MSQVQGIGAPRHAVAAPEARASRHTPTPAVPHRLDGAADDHRPRPLHQRLRTHPRRRVVRARITSYNVCYTKLLRAPGGAYALDAYRLAFVSLALPWIVGVIGIVVTRRAARRDWAADGVVVAPWREALAARRRAQRPEAD